MSIRQERVQSQLLETLSELIHKELRDPRIGFLTLTGAEITDDLRYAKVYVSVLGEPENVKQSLKILNSAAGMLRGEFARRAHLRIAPEIVFQQDIGIERGRRIFDILNSLEETRPKPEGETGAPATEASEEA